MTPADRLASAVRERRLALGLRQEDLVDRAHRRGYMLSVQTVRAIEAGERPAIRPTTDTAMCAALDWPRGALARILQGHEPPPDDEPSPAHDLETKVAELVQRQLAQAQEQEYRSDAARQLAAWFDTLTDEQRHDLIERLAGLAQANAR